MTLEDAAHDCEACRDVLAGRSIGRFDFACISCRARSISREPAPRREEMLAARKEQLLASHFAALQALVAAWDQHDHEGEDARHDA